MGAECDASADSQHHPNPAIPLRLLVERLAALGTVIRSDRSHVDERSSPPQRLRTNILRMCHRKVAKKKA